METLEFTASGMTFGALAWGPADGPLALCLHGYPDTAWTWRRVAPAFADRGWRVVAPFMRGYAPTGPAPGGTYEIGALAHDAIEAHRALGGDERSVLIGHDWGAAATYCAASAAPRAFARVVTLSIAPPAEFYRLLNPASALSADRGLMLSQLRQSWYMMFNQLPRVSERSLGWLIPRLWAAWSPGYDAREDLQHVRAALPDAAHRTAALRYYRALFMPWYRSPEYASEQAHAERVPASPLLYLHGRNDGCMRAELAERSAPGLAPNGRVEIVEGAGHFLQLEQPDRVAELILDFIGSPSP